MLADEAVGYGVEVAFNLYVIVSRDPRQPPFGEIAGLKGLIARLEVLLSNTMLKLLGATCMATVFEKTVHYGIKFP
ncbi:hypothetical protein [Agrobacterium tumefaciens]|uniref:hypothetical protein n=1 Tax=Agrobacterium tumefaciens TaxID=358 RepID=UPI000977B397|nr:hypothetical protein BV900_17085 [Agrobacterium tumefaciens]